MMAMVYRWAYRTAHLLRSIYRHIFQPTTYGVKVLCTNAAGHVLLIRHSYGRSDLWMLPGGGVGRGENPAAAAKREIAEETGCHITGIVQFSTHVDLSKGGRNCITLFTASTNDTPQIDGKELVAAAFYDPNRPPETLSEATGRRLAEWRGEQAVDDHW